MFNELAITQMSVANKQKVVQALTAVDYMIDKFIETRNLDILELFNVKQVFDTIDINSKVANVIKQTYEFEYNEFLCLVADACDEEVKEAYSFLTDAEQQSIFNVYSDVMDACDQCNE